MRYARPTRTDTLTLRSSSSATSTSHRPAPPAPPVDLQTARDARGYRRTAATTPEFHRGRAPRNKGHVYPPDPPTVSECMAMLRACEPTLTGRRLFAAIILLWQGALRSFEALALTEGDIDDRAGRILIRRGKGGKRATIAMAGWAWPFLEDWRTRRHDLPNPAGPLLCVAAGPTAGRRAWSYSSLNAELKHVAHRAGVTRRISPHQFRHAWAAQAYTDGIDLRTIQLHLRHAHLGVTDVYLQGLGLDMSREAVYQLPVPMVPATELLALHP